MESYAPRHGLVDSLSKIDLSEYALVSLTFDDSIFTSSTGTAAADKTATTDIYNCLRNGGNDQYVFKTLTKWAGLMNETDYPYIYAGNTESTYDASKVSYILTGQHFINMQNMDLVKQAIMDYGTTIPASSFVVVDADDSSVTHVSDGPGGWLIKNSWRNSGYMWISYYDKSIINVSCCAYEIAPRSEYDYNYQYDGGDTFFVIIEFNEVTKIVTEPAGSINIWQCRRCEWRWQD